jgi:hypothetical protein
MNGGVEGTLSDVVHDVMRGFSKPLLLDREAEQL